MPPDTSMLDRRVLLARDYPDTVIAFRAKGRYRDDPAASHVKQHTIPDDLPGDAILALKSHITVISGVHYERIGSVVTWRSPYYPSIDAEVIARSPDGAALWRWSPLHGDMSIDGLEISK